MRFARYDKNGRCIKSGRSLKNIERAARWAAIGSICFFYAWLLAALMM